MKRIFGIIFAVMFLLALSSCIQITPSKQVRKTNADDYCRMCVVCKKTPKTFSEIWVDTNTDVLYYTFQSSTAFGMTPIMKADGTCLTYTEWKAKNDNRKAN